MTGDDLQLPLGRQPAPPPSHVVRSNPGRLRGRITLKLQSQAAAALVTGRPAGVNQPAILGLLGFAGKLRELWWAAARDDPYADWWLIRIEDRLAAGHDAIDTECRRLEASLRRHPTLSIQIGASRRPVRFNLRFANPYAFRAAGLIGTFDRLARVLLTAEHVALISGETSHRLLGTAAGEVRRVLTSAEGYQVMDLNRARLRADSVLAEAARGALGELPADVLSGERRPALSPPMIRPAMPEEKSESTAAEAVR